MAQHRSRRAAGTSGVRRYRLLLTAVLVASSILSINLPAGAAGVAPAGDDLIRDGPFSVIPATPGPTKPGYSRLVDTTAVLQPAPAAGSGRRTVFVQLTGPGAAQVSAELLAKGQNSTQVQDAVRARLAAVAAHSAAVSAAASAADPAAVTIFRVANAVPGLGLTADATALRDLALRPDVEKISAIVPKTPANAGVAQLTRALQTWTDLGVTGTGARVGVLDTGIDYTHADFGGPGTPSAYLAARAAASGSWTPTTKVAGGRDFVGDNYDAAPTTPAGTVNAAYQPIPRPDANPLDCNGHGTHIAGTIAGQGVDANGRPFTGNYSTLRGPDLYSMKVAPGMAPTATLYALKVFGCSGATDAVIPALDWALDPDGDGNFADHLDVVDLSLTGGSGVTDDPETGVLDAVARLGVLPVVAAGNGGDQTDSAGSAAASVQSLVVASSVDPDQYLDGLKAHMPGAAPAIVEGQASTAYPWERSADVTGQVVSLSSADADGCAPLSAADSAKVAGKVAWLVGDEDDPAKSCGSAGSANVRSAGAVGVVLTGTAPVVGAEIGGDPGLPVFQLTPGATAALQAGVDHGLTVTFSAGLTGNTPDVDNSVTDTIQSDSARGAHGLPGAVKPDVAAPGAGISSALIGSGDGNALRSGTSTAAAVAAGVAALVATARPSWTPEQIKAAVMNTADHDVYARADKGGPALGPDRVGSGRLDAESAVTTRVLAFSSTTPGAVLVSFGVVPADVRLPTVSATSAVVMQNTGAGPAVLALSYQGLVGQLGVSYQVTPARMVLPAGASALATVTMTIVPKDLRHTLDPGSPAQQRDTLTGLDEARQYVTTAAGRLLVSVAGGSGLRVPVYGAAKPVADTSAADGTLGGAPALVLSGTGLSLASPAEPSSTTYDSLVSVLDLGYRSTAIPTCAAMTGAAEMATGPTVSTIAPKPGGGGQKAAASCALGSDRTGDLEAVGAGRAQPTGSGPGYLWFGLSTYGDWATVGKSTFPTVNIDTNGDNTADYTIQVQTVGGRSDLLYAMLFDDDGPGSLIGIYPVNFNLGNVDTNVFDTNVLLIPVDPAAIGYRTSMSSFPIRYSVATYSTQGAPQNGGMVDTTPAIGFDVARPAIATAAPLWRDQGGVGIPYRLAAGRSSAQALVLHLHGAGGSRAQVIGLHGGTG